MHGQAKEPSSLHGDVLRSGGDCGELEAQAPSPGGALPTSSQVLHEGCTATESDFLLSPEMPDMQILM